MDQKIQNAYLLGDKSNSLEVVQSDEGSTVTMPQKTVSSLVPVVCLELAK